MGGPRKLTILLTVALTCALVLSACGGGGGSSTATGSAEAGTTASTPESSAKPNGGGGGKNGNGKNGGGSGSGSSKGSGEGSKGSSAPVKLKKVKISAGEERSERFKVKGGDNSIPNYGEEAAEESRAEAQNLVNEFFAIEQSGETAKLCNLISAKNLASIRAISEQSSKLKGKNCGEILNLMLQQATSKPPYTPKTEIVSMRTENEIAFALYIGIDGKNYAFPMTQEGGKWKLTALAPTPMG